MGGALLKQLLSMVGLALVVCLVLASWTNVPSVSALCDFHNAATVNQRLECGEIAWELKARDEVGTEYDEGEWDQTGMCGGSYTNCNCQYVEPYVIEASESFVESPNDDGSITFWWDLRGYNLPTYTTCTSGSCAGTGQIETKNPILENYAGYDTEYPMCNP